MLGEKTTHGRTRPIAGYETNTLRGDGYEVADPKDEIPLAMKPGSHGNQADDVFLSFSKNLGLQSEQAQGMPNCHGDSLHPSSPPSGIDEGFFTTCTLRSSIVCCVTPSSLQMTYPFSLVLMHPSIHQTMLFWWYGFTSNGQTLGGGVEVVHSAPFVVANPHESLLSCGRPGLGASEPYDMPMFASSLTFAKRHAHKIAHSE